MKVRLRFICVKLKISKLIKLYCFKYQENFFDCNKFYVIHIKGKAIYKIKIWITKRY